MMLYGIAAENAEERIAAKQVLRSYWKNPGNPVVPLEEDEVSRVIDGDVNETVYSEIKNWTVAELGIHPKGRN